MDSPADQSFVETPKYRSEHPARRQLTNQLPQAADKEGST